MTSRKQHPAELRERAVAMVFELRAESGSARGSTDWEAAVAALHAGELPASGGERRTLLLAASIAGGTPVSLCETLPGIDRRNASLVVGAVAHAAGLTDQETDKR